MQRLVKRLNLTMVNAFDVAIRFFLSILIIMLPFSKASVGICIAFMLMWWLLKRIFVLTKNLAGERKAQDSKLIVLLRTFKPETSILNGPIGLFIFVAILSAIGSLYFSDFLRAFFGKILRSIILYFIIIESVKQRKHIFILVCLFFLSAVVVSFDGFIQYFFAGVDIFFLRQMDKGAASASFNHPNSLGAYLIFPLLLVTAMLKDKFRALVSKYQVTRNKFQAAGFLFLFCLFGFAMILTKSRGAWFGALSGILMLILITYRRVFIWLVIGTVLVLTLIFLIAPKTTLRNFRLEPILVQDSYFGRMGVWMDTVDMIKDRPVFGHGINTYMKEFQKYRQMPWQYPTYAHNCYLQIAAEMGLFGLMVFLWIVGKFFRRTIMSYKEGLGEIDSNLLLGIMAGLFAFLVHSFFDTNLYSLQLNTLFWYMMGLAVAVMRLEPDVNTQSKL